MKKPKILIHFMPIYGCVSTGMIYLGIGLVALLSFFKLKDGGADESSLFSFLNEYWVGKIVVWIILLGTICYIIWRIYESIADPYDYGRNFVGFAKRLGIALSSVADIFIAYSAILVLFGTSNFSTEQSQEEQQQIISELLSQRNGDVLVITVGCIVFFTAIVQFVYGITRGYKERINIAHLCKRVKNLIHVFAWIGYFARGIIIGIVGFFILKAGIAKDSSSVVNTDKAFDFIGDNIGHLPFILIALGTISYALFMFFLGAFYDSDKN